METLGAWLVLLPVAPAIAAVIFFPASGILSDSLAASGDAWLPVLLALGYAAAGALEYWARGRSEGLLVSAPFALNALTTIDQDLLVDGGACDAYCVLHSVALFVYSVCELAGLWSRGYSLAVLVPAAVALAVLAIVYRGVLWAEDFDATHGPTRQFLYWCGLVQVCALLAARVLVATAQ